MFGEKPILGRDTGKFDEKGRIHIPTFTGIEIGDDLVIVASKDNCSIDIYNVNDYIKMLNDLRNLEFKVEGIEQLMRLKHTIEFMKSNVYRIVDCKSQKRVLIPQEARTDINIHDFYICEGNGDSLSIFSPESYAVRKIGPKK